MRVHVKAGKLQGGLAHEWKNMNKPPEQDHTSEGLEGLGASSWGRQRPTLRVNFNPGRLESRRWVELQHPKHSTLIYTGASKGTALSPRWLVAGHVCVCIACRCTHGYSFVLLRACGYRITAALDPLDWRGKIPPLVPEARGFCCHKQSEEYSHVHWQKKNPWNFFS